MKIQLLVCVLALSLLVLGCTQDNQLPEQVEDQPKQDAPVEAEPANTDTQKEIAIDTNDNGKADVKVEQKEDTTEVTIDFDDVQPEEAKSAPSEAFCVPGETYKHAGEEGDVDSEIIGLEQYKGKEFCKARSTTSIETPAGMINTDSTYYFDQENKELWVIAEVSSALMPEPQVTEIHLVDGEIVS